MIYGDDLRSARHWCINNRSSGRKLENTAFSQARPDTIGDTTCTNICEWNQWSHLFNHREVSEAIVTNISLLTFNGTKVESLRIYGDLFLNMVPFVLHIVEADSNHSTIEIWSVNPRLSKLFHFAAQCLKEIHNK